MIEGALYLLPALLLAVVLLAGRRPGERLIVALHRRRAPRAARRVRVHSRPAPRASHRACSSPRRPSDRRRARRPCAARLGCIPQLLETTNPLPAGRSSVVETADRRGRWLSRRLIVENDDGGGEARGRERQCDISITRRGLQITLGLIWLLDGALQFQSFMYSHGFIEMLTGMAPGQPGWLGSSITWGAHLAAAQSDGLEHVVRVRAGGHRVGVAVPADGQAGADRVVCLGADRVVVRRGRSGCCS